MELLAVNEFTYHLLLVLSIEPPDVKTHQGKFLQLFFLVDISVLSAVSCVRLPWFAFFLQE